MTTPPRQPPAPLADRIAARIVYGLITATVLATLLIGCAR